MVQRNHIRQETEEKEKGSVMGNIIEAEFRIIQERTPEVIAAEITYIENQVTKTVIQGAIEIGTRLKEAKEKVGHGSWTGWCEQNLGYSQSKATKFMEISEKYGDENSAYHDLISNSDTCTNMSISKALRLLQVPEEEVKTFTEKVDVESTTVKELEEQIKKLKAEKEISSEELEKKIAAAEEDRNRLRQQLEEYQGEELQEEQSTVQLEEAQAKVELKEKEIERLQAELDKAKKKADKMEQAKIKTDETIDQAISEAVDKAKQEAAAEAQQKLYAEIDRARADKKAAEEAASEAQKKLESLNNEDIVLIKIKINELQETFADACNCISNIATTDENQAGKLRAGLKAIMESMIGKI